MPESPPSFPYSLQLGVHGGQESFLTRQELFLKVRPLKITAFSEASIFDTFSKGIFLRKSVLVQLNILYLHFLVFKCHLIKVLLNENIKWKSTRYPNMNPFIKGTVSRCFVLHLFHLPIPMASLFSNKTDFAIFCEFSKMYYQFSLT